MRQTKEGIVMKLHLKYRPSQPEPDVQRVPAVQPARRPPAEPEEYAWTDRLDWRGIKRRPTTSRKIHRKIYGGDE
jgi:hypothetical protein